MALKNIAVKKKMKKTTKNKDKMRWGINDL